MPVKQGIAAPVQLAPGLAPMPATNATLGDGWGNRSYGHDFPHVK